MRKATALFACLIALPSQAQTIDDASDSFQACLYAQAIMYGHQSCHAPTELVPAIYASCRPEENAMRKAMISKGYKRPIVEGTMEGFREGFDPKLVKMLIDGQIKRGCS